MVDRISNLPDEVLCHILSFLPTEEAVATIVLSKRWRPLWPSVSTLDFDDDRYLERRFLEGRNNKSNFSFIKFVYAAIVSRRLNQPIKTFSLVSDECPDSVAKVWLTAAIQPQLESLKIRLDRFKVPCSVLTCANLVAIKFRFVSFDVFSTVHLPSLKKLHLKYVWFLKSQFLVELLNGCPILEDLKADEITFDDSSFEGGNVKTLSKLVRADVFFDGDFCIPVKVFSNVEFLRIEECDDAVIPVFPNLVYLELDYVKWRLALDMLQRCSKLQTIVFNIVHDEEEVWPYNCFVPAHFPSHLRKCFLKDFEGLECQMRFARYVMESSASLHTMTIDSVCQNQEKEVQMIKELASYPRSSSICELLFE